MGRDMDRKFIFRAKNQTGRNLLGGWWKGGKNQRQVPKGLILDRLSFDMLLFTDDIEALRLMGYHKSRDPDRWEIYEVIEVSEKDLTKMIWEMLPDDVNGEPPDTPPQG